MVKTRKEEEPYIKKTNRGKVKGHTQKEKKRSNENGPPTFTRVKRHAKNDLIRYHLLGGERKEVGGKNGVA